MTACVAMFSPASVYQWLVEDQCEMMKEQRHRSDGCMQSERILTGRSVAGSGALRAVRTRVGGVEGGLATRMLARSDER